MGLSFIVILLVAEHHMEIRAVLLCIAAWVIQCSESVKCICGGGWEEGWRSVGGGGGAYYDQYNNPLLMSRGAGCILQP